jgi:hypothetical protein
MRRKAQVVGIAAMAAGVLALSPALASGHTFVAPGAIAFPGSTEVGKTSAPQVTVVYSYCTVYTTSCNAPGIFQPSPSITGDFLQTNNCGTGAIPQTSPGPVPDCVFTVTFKPKAPGLRTGTLTVGSDLGGGTQPGTVNLTGAGVPGPSSSGTGTTGTKKKCKAKKRSAQIAKKKCKKK